VQISDVTLREGDQQPGTDYGVDQKIEVGRLLDRLGIDFVQAGFPITGETDRRAIRGLSGELEADVVGLARALPSDIEAAASADADVVDIIIPASAKQRPYVVGGTREEVFETAREAVNIATDQGLSVHLSLMDAFRSETETVLKYYKELPEVLCITLADTVGVAVPSQVRSFLEGVVDAVDPGRVGAHFHNDLGVATANSLAAGEVGVEKVDVSVSAIGERAGNAPLEELVMAGTVGGTVEFNIEIERLLPVCTEILKVLGESAPSNKPGLGERVFAHESGLHTAAMLDDPSAFEPFDPGRFGGSRRLIFGEQTGRGAARKLLKRADRDLSDELVAELLSTLSELGPVSFETALEIAADIGND
jgi:isopropylmalate/homocitrate/citramalate synthase